MGPHFPSPSTATGLSMGSTRRWFMLFRWQFSVFWAFQCPFHISPYFRVDCQNDETMRLQNSRLFRRFSGFCGSSRPLYGCANVLIHLLTDLGFAVDWNKVVAPTRRIRFLKIVVDSARQRLEIPPEKLLTLSELTKMYSTRRKMKKKELVSGGLHVVCRQRRLWGQNFCWSYFKFKAHFWSYENNEHFAAWTFMVAKFCRRL